MDYKQKLATLIDAYADAKRTGNEALIQFATGQLQEFFTSFDVVPTTPPAVETPDSDPE